MEGQASISGDVLARYAADAAREVEGVRGLVASQLHRHRGVRVSDDGVELHLELEWGLSIPATGRNVQRAVAAYLERMAAARPGSVDIVVDAVGPAK